MNHEIIDTWYESTNDYRAACSCGAIFANDARNGLEHIIAVVKSELSLATDFYKSMALDDDLDANYRQTQFETACDITDRLFNKEEGTTLDEHRDE
jgi:hypothetical protein